MDKPRLPPQVWAVMHDIVIMDPDGWRTPGAPSFWTPITEEEFNERKRCCTVARLGVNPSETMRDFYLSRVEDAIRKVEWADD